LFINVLRKQPNDHLQKQQKKIDTARTMNNAQMKLSQKSKVNVNN